MNFAEKTTAEVIAELAAKTPVPGGGGAAALVGAVGTALGNMVGSFTKGKKKFSAVEGDIIELQNKCDNIQMRLLQLMDEDAVSFEPLSKAYAMKEDTEEQRLEKDKVMAEATLTACKVPVEIMEVCCSAIDILEGFLKKGNPLLVSDVGVGVLCCKAALQGAAMNVYINTKTMKNREQAEEYNKKTDSLVAKYGEKADLIYQSVLRQLQ
ncbi:MAG: cyclodeaminase/cyclohydrolase family protein [Bacillota bacterium]|nr:cyclodeaminase/cyclohydrolase family protein [Bacillota bacterium]